MARLILLSLLAIWGSVSGVVEAAALRKRAISNQMFTTMQLYEQYAAAAYCPGNDNGTSTKITCSAGNCPDVQAANTTITLSIDGSPLTGTAGYVAVDDTHQLIIAAFRGTETVRNYLVDVITLPSLITTCPGCLGYMGVWAAWLEVRGEVIEAVQTAKAANPGYNVLVAGHSLGGAIATVGTAEIRNAGTAADMCTFGSPRFGNAAFASFMEAQEPSLGNNYRLMHKSDPIPTLPLQLAGYTHVVPGYFITTGNDVPPTASQINVQATDVNNPWGSTLDEDNAAHGFYFNHIGDCYPGGGLQFR